MIRKIRAIYEEGVFRPLDSLKELPDRTTVQLHVETVARDGGRLSDFAGLWTEQEADEVAALVEAEFERIDPRDW